MEKRIYLPNFEAVRHFVRESEACDDTVMVSKEGLLLQVRVLDSQVPFTL